MKLSVVLLLHSNAARYQDKLWFSSHAGAHCQESVTRDERGMFRWRETAAPGVAITSCPVTNVSVNATRLCYQPPGRTDPTALWEEPDTSVCTITNQLRVLSQMNRDTDKAESVAFGVSEVNRDSDAAESVVSVLEDTAYLTRNASSLSSVDVQYTAAILQNVAQALADMEAADQSEISQVCHTYTNSIVIIE